MCTLAGAFKASCRRAALTCLLPAVHDTGEPTVYPNAGTDDAAAAAHASAALPSPVVVLQDCDAADDSEAPTVPEATAAQAEAEASAAAESVRAATLQRLQDIKLRLEQVCSLLHMAS
jgi:hypothetical protein